MIPKIPVRFICVGPDGEETVDSQVDALCMSVPRIGERVQPVAGGSKIVVDVVHDCFSEADIAPFDCAVSITVLLRDAPEERKLD
jgi:hypothetical protein